MAGVKTLRGGDLQVYFNGHLFGIATSIRWQTNDGSRSIYGIDQYTPFEIAPGQSSIRGSVECTRQRMDGGLEGRGVTAPESRVMYKKYASLAVVDRSTDTVILAVEGVVISDQSWNVGAKGLLTGSFSFEGLEWSNEANT